MSTVPEVLTALTTIGVATFPNGQVVNGTLEAAPTTRGSLLLIGDQDFEIIPEFDSLAGVTTTERYVIPCSIVASVAGSDQAIADAQCWADYEAFAAAIATTPQLGLQASFSLQAAVVGPQTFMRKADPDGRQAAIRFGIDTFAAND